MLLLKSFLQEDENDEHEEEKSRMEDTVDQTGTEEDADETDDKILIGKRTHQVSPLHFKCFQQRSWHLLFNISLKEISRY